MKILLCHNFYRLPGGEDQVFFDEGRLLEEHGHTVIRFEKTNAEIEEISRGRLAKETIWNSRSKKEVEALLVKHRPDIVHFHNTFPLISPAAWSAARKHGVPVVQSLHNFRMICPGSTLLRDGAICEKCIGKTFAIPSVVHGCYRDSRVATGVVAARNAFHRLRRSVSRNVDTLIALTDHSRRKFIDAGLPADKIVVKPNFVSPDPGERTHEGEAAIFVGRLSPEKGVQVLLDAWKQPDHSTPLVIVGDGPLKDQVQRCAENNPNVTWLGQLPFEDVLHRIRQSRMLIMPSIWYETFGRTMIEAFAAGVPVVASNIGAMREIVSDGFDGLHFQAGSAADLARKVQLLQSRPELRTKIGKQARMSFLRKFSADKNYDLLLAIYQNLVSVQNNE